MGSLRRRLNRAGFPLTSVTATAAAFALISAGPARAANACETERPYWTPGAPATVLDELIHLAMSPLTIGLAILTVLAVRFRSKWGGLIVCLMWSFLASILAFGWVPAGRAELRAAAITEGCIGSPALFIGLVAAICVAMILFTTPPERRDPSKE